MRLGSRAACAALAILIGFVGVGCRSDPYQVAAVTGEVTCNGSPATGGWVIFEPLDEPERTGRPKGSPGGISRAMVQEDGSFTLRMDAKGARKERAGALVGPHRVSFTPPRTQPVEWDPSDDWLPEESKAELREKLASYEVFEPLECGTTISPSQVEVEGGENNHFGFTLSGSPQRKNPALSAGGSD